MRSRVKYDGQNSERVEQYVPNQLVHESDKQTTDRQNKDST